MILSQTRATSVFTALSLCCYWCDLSHFQDAMTDNFLVLQRNRTDCPSVLLFKGRPCECAQPAVVSGINSMLEIQKMLKAGQGEKVWFPRPKMMELGKITVCTNKGRVTSRFSWKMTHGYGKVFAAQCQMSGLGCCPLQGPHSWVRSWYLR